MCNDKNLFTEFHPQENSKIQHAVDKSTKVTEIGKDLIIVPSDTGKTYHTLNNVLCILEMKCYLISTSKAISNHCSVIFKECYAKIIEPNGSTLVKAVMQGNLCYTIQSPSSMQLLLPRKVIFKSGITN